MTSPSPRSLVGGAAANLTGSLRVPDPQGPPPPLPEGIPFVAPDFRAGLLADENGPHAPFRTVRGGCYLARYTPLQTSPTHPGAVHYFGTLRVDTDRSTITVSGDLYLHRIPTPPSPGRPEPDPGSGIPVFPLRDYRYYVRATQVLNDPADNESFTLQFELFRFIPATGSWSNDGAFTTALRWATTPPGYPSGAD